MTPLTKLRSIIEARTPEKYWKHLTHSNLSILPYRHFIESPHCCSRDVMKDKAFLECMGTVADEVMAVLEAAQVPRSANRVDDALEALNAKLAAYFGDAEEAEK